MTNSQKEGGGHDRKTVPDLPETLGDAMSKGTGKNPILQGISPAVPPN
jgi:hypothetical protein